MGGRWSAIDVRYRDADRGGKGRSLRTRNSLFPVYGRASLSVFSAMGIAEKERERERDEKKERSQSLFALTRATLCARFVLARHNESAFARRRVPISDIHLFPCERGILPSMATRYCAGCHNSVGPPPLRNATGPRDASARALWGTGLWDSVHCRNNTHSRCSTVIVAATVISLHLVSRFSLSRSLSVCVFCAKQPEQKIARVRTERM